MLNFRDCIYDDLHNVKPCRETYVAFFVLKIFFNKGGGIVEFIKIKDELNYSAKKYKTTREIEDIFLEFGYIKFEPSIFEDYDNFISINKRIRKEAMVKVIDGNSKVLILRPDITTNIIKNLMPRWQDNLKVRLFYNSSIFMNKLGSNIKEFKQIGIEYLGEKSLVADVEVIELVFKILKKYRDTFIIEIGSSKYLNGLLKEVSLKGNLKGELKNLIYKKNKNEIVKYVDRLNLKEEIKNLFSEILNFQGSIEEVIKKARQNYMNKEMKKAIEELEDFENIIKNHKNLENVHLDLSLVTELDYYDGLVFKGYYKNSYKEIISGGRYDSLTKTFGQKISAVGFSIDLDELVKLSYRDGE